MSKLLLVDGYSLLYRAFFSSPPLTTKAGEPTGALYGFIRMVILLLDENQPDYAVVALDPHGPTFRHDADATYKANRSETPDELRRQQVTVREMLDGLSIPRYEHAGFEADDVLGTLACRGVSHGQQVIIVTGDGDSLQLADEKVRVLLTRKGVTEVDSYGPPEVMARFGFGPALLPDFKGLKGDSSDNIPGVPGIGDKTGMALIHKFGGLEGIYEHLEEVTPPRIKELLRTHRDQAFHSRHLATIVTDLPVEAQPEDFRYDAVDPAKRAKAAETARRFEFKSLVQRYESALTVPSPAGLAEAAEAPVLLEAAWTTLSDAAEALDWLRRPELDRGEGSGLTAVGQVSDGLWLGRGGEALLFTGDLLATSGSVPRDPGPQAQASLDFGDGGEPLIADDTPAASPLAGPAASELPAGSLAEWLAGPEAKVAHDAKGLIRSLRRQGIELGGLVADTLVMGYLAEPTRQQHPTEYLTGKFLNVALPAPAVSAKKSKNAGLFDEPASEEEVARSRDVAAAAVAVLPALSAALAAVLEEMGHRELWEELERPLLPVLATIEECGMLLDPAALRTLGNFLESEARRLESEIWESAGEKFNIGSTKQLQVILYDKLGLEKGRTIKTGASTDVHTLERLSEKHDVVRKILDYRGVTKLKTTYVDALLNLMDPVTHRVHTTLNQTGAVSGRLSSIDPNLQNIPIRTEQGRLIRKAFVAPEGHVLLSADYSQVELRVLASITGDAPLVDAFKTGEDVHTRTAAALFHVPVGEVDKEMRRKAKMTNYAIAYGVSGFGLAKQLGSGTSGEAQEFIKEYFEALPGVKTYIDDTIKLAKSQGYVETLLHRRRPLPDINAPRFPDRAAAERTAINHPVQGSAADMMKLAMIEVQKELESRSLASRMTMQVHDELVFEVPVGEVALMTELVQRAMTKIPAQRLHLNVPLVADVGTGANWDTAKGSE